MVMDYQFFSKDCSKLFKKYKLLSTLKTFHFSTFQLPTNKQINFKRFNHESVALHLIQFNFEHLLIGITAQFQSDKPYSFYRNTAIARKTNS